MREVLVAQPFRSVNLQSFKICFFWECVLGQKKLPSLHLLVLLDHVLLEVVSVGTPARGGGGGGGGGVVVGGGAGGGDGGPGGAVLRAAVACIEMYANPCVSFIELAKRIEGLREGFFRAESTEMYCTGKGGLNFNSFSPPNVLRRRKKERQV